MHVDTQQKTNRRSLTVSMISLEIIARNSGEGRALAPKIEAPERAVYASCDQTRRSSVDAIIAVCVGEVVATRETACFASVSARWPSSALLRRAAELISKRSVELLNFEPSTPCVNPAAVGLSSGFCFREARALTAPGCCGVRVPIFALALAVTGAAFATSRSDETGAAFASGSDGFETRPSSKAA